MSVVVSSDGGDQAVTERLLEDSWEARGRRASQRELAVEATAGALFVAAAVALLVLTGAAQAVRLEVAAALVALYAGVVRVEFPVGAGHVVPTQLVLVPMLALLPPGAVPVAVMVGLTAPAVVDWALGRMPARRILSAVPDAWHAVGPALVLLIAGSPRIDFDALPLMTLAFAACCVVDLGSSLVRIRLVGIVPDVKVQARVMLTVWAVDVCLAPLGFVTAVTTQHSLGALAFILPLAVLLWWLARDRTRRIEQAHARLKLLEHERFRLQSAVHRLGDAFAAKLDLDALLTILVNGAMEALDASAGRLQLEGLPSPRQLTAGHADRLRDLDAAARGVPPVDWAVQIDGERAWTLILPFAIAGEHRNAMGTLSFNRDARPFQDDEVELLRRLVSKAEQAGAEILANQALREHAVTDALTGLGNRRRLANDLARAFDRAAGGQPVLLLLFDLDGFKAYNDMFGHPAGDALLTRLGAKLSAAVGPSGGAYRLGGDEFCALLDLDTDEFDQLIATTAVALSERGSQFSIGASLGAVLLPHEADTPDLALQLADERMYATKRGRAAGPRDQARDVLIRTMEAKQPHLDEHSSEVASLAVRVGRQLGLRGETLEEIARGAELHDIGKVGIPDAILSKPAPLDADEWEFMRQHPILGERILNAAPALRALAPMVRSSHERWDGKGYPDGLAGEQIPLGARIVAVCDAYEAMTADRAYRKALPRRIAREELRASAGTQFDPAVVEAFLAALDAGETDVGPRTAVHDAADHIRAVLVQSPRRAVPAAG